MMRAMVAALFSAIFSGIIGAALAAALSILPSYGWTLFLGVPFLLGLFCGVLMNLARPSKTGETLGAAALSLALSGGALLIWRIEGAYCLFMSIPIALPLTLLGAVLGRAICRATRPRQGQPALLLLLPLIAIPSGLAERTWHAPQEARPVVTSIDINAEPAVVWKYVVSFPDLHPPSEWYFRTGISYPVRARIEGSGSGAVRYCEFSTGVFVEPIEVWDEPRLLRFSVSENPPPMTELNPFGRVYPAHLHGFMESKAGQFRLVPLDGGHRTRLEGTTWYRHGLWPERYWRWWADAIIHRIHLRVLSHIRSLSEAR